MLCLNNDNVTYVLEKSQLKNETNPLPDDVVISSQYNPDEVE